ncbi:citrate synthase [Halapricum sp. CBA1109]|uniref:citrate synthase n=1 Tax=Halapricum sp. CBA1109 TaxID=2668068 RepID=UPI0012F7592B|nr:citrate synthase [Halapricum sp. CBA1109]MUV90352.1 citrate synthase [Halapricum sp. CBA1109]
MTDELKKGLEGVVVAESALSHIDGDAGRLVYRGYAIEDLAGEASYEEVLYLLWHGELPTAEALSSFSSDMAEHRAVDEDVLSTVRDLATADENPMAALRTATSMLSAYDEDTEAGDRESDLEHGKRITAKMPTLVAAFKRLRDGEEPVEPRADLSHAANFLYMLNGEEPDDTLAEVFDMALVLHADHGLNASTFAAMVTGSTMSDLYSAVTSAIGTLKGGLHGGANQNVMQMLTEVDESDKPAVQWVDDALDGGRRIPGFGHRVYNVKDPRAKILGEKSQALGEAAGDLKWYSMSQAIEEYIAENKGLAPNVDFYSASTYYQMGIPIDLFTPIFAMSRAGGWIAHFLEYQSDNRLIRPRARYTGPTDLTFTPVEQR